MTQHKSLAQGGAAGIPSDIRWSLPNGFGSTELPDESLLPKAVGTVSYGPSSLRPGLEVHTFAADLKSPVTMSHQILTGQPYLLLEVVSSGLGEYRHGSGINGVFPPDWSCCAMLRDPVTDFSYASGGHRIVGMGVTPDRLQEILQGQRLHQLVDDFLGGGFDPEVLAFRPTAALRAIAGQIHDHPYQGAMAALFLEAKAFEMLAEGLHVLAGDSRSDGTGGRARRLALAAREIFEADPANPPRIGDVARQVGLSQRRLNEVFREVFDASPLQCLVHWRLDQARQLLAAGELTVKQVAHQAGYAHVSNFSLAFTRRFGHPPTATPDE